MIRYRTLISIGLVLLSLAVALNVAVASKNVLAIFSLRPTNMEAMDYSGDILYTLISALGKEDDIEVMPRREMEENLFQEGLAQGDNPKQVVKAGNALGVNFVLFGNVTAKGGKVRAELKLMDVPNQRIINTWTPVFSGREAIESEIIHVAESIKNDIANRDPFIAAAPAAQPTQQTINIEIENLRARTQDGKVVLRWKFDKSQPIVGFNVYRAVKKEGPYQFLGTTLKNAYTDSELSSGQLYFYNIGIMLQSGAEQKSALTANVNFTTEKMPYPPLIIKGRGYVRRASIEFVPSLQNEQEKFKISQYKIYRQVKNEGDWKYVRSLDAKQGYQSSVSIIAEDKKLPDDDLTCNYALASVDKKGRESPLSDPIAIRTVKRPALLLEKDDLLRENRFSWTPVKAVNGYILYRRVTQQNWKKVGRISGASKSSYSDKFELEDGLHYQYYLTCYDDQSESGPSNIVDAKTKDLPIFPQNLAAEGGLVKSVKLSWVPVDDPDIGGYTVYRGDQPGNFTKIGRVKGYRTGAYLDKGKVFKPLEDGKTYYYKLVSFNLFNAEGEPTPVIQVTTKPRPVTARGLAVMAETEQITVKWEPNPESDIQKYTLYRNKNGGSWSKITDLGGGQNNFHDKNLTPDVVYRYRVIVQDTDGLKSDPVESEPVKSPIIKTQ